LFGHRGSEALKTNGNIHDIKMSGSIEISQDCATAEAKKKNMSMIWSRSSKVAGEWLYTNISPIKERSF
jgi:hypothetical protein